MRRLRSGLPLRRIAYVVLFASLAASLVRQGGSPFAQQAAAAPLAQGSSGLVATYGFEEGGGLTARDGSGNNNNGTLNGATWVPGRFGNGLSFDGNDWVTVNDAGLLDLTTGMTLEAWVRPTTISGWRSAIFKERPGGLAYVLYASNGTAPQGQVRLTTGGEPRARQSAAIPLNTWTHLALTYDGAALRLYVNGVVTGTTAASGSITVSDGPLRIGGNAVWGEYFSGLIDEVRLYNRALSQTEIQTDMNASVAN